MVPQDELQPAWTLILGPGPAMDLVRVMVAGLAPRHAAVQWLNLSTPLPEAPPPTPRGRLVLHTSELEAEHVPSLGAFLENHTGWEVILIHSGPGPHLARDLMGPSYVHWWPSPLQLAQVAYLFEPPGARRAARFGVEAPGVRSEIGLVRPAQAPLAPTSPSTPPNPKAFGAPTPSDFESEERPPRAASAPRQEWGASLTEVDPDREFSDGPDLSDGEMGAIQAILSGSFLPESPEDSHPSDALSAEDAPVRSPWQSAARSRRRDPDDVGPHPLPHEGSIYEDAAPGRAVRPHALEALRSSPPERPQAPPSSRPRQDEDSLASALLTALGAPPSAPREGHTETQTAEDSTDFAHQDLAAQTCSVEQAPPPWYRDQVADLSDLAQRLHLDLFAIEEAHGPSGSPALGALREDVARLTQFTRTLGFLAAAPGRGQQDLSLSTLVQEQLASLAGLGEDAPRFLFKGSDDIRVRSDKGLLIGALDAVLQVAAQCAGSHPQTVRVACVREEAWAYLTVEFSPGPLTVFQSGSPERLFVPYQLKELLPTIGPNALGAARAILRGQGGDLRWEPEGLQSEDSESRCAFVARLPHAP